MIEIIRTARSIIPATHLRKTGISVPPYVFILKGGDSALGLMDRNLEEVNDQLILL